jgi:hypothetical protein
MNTNEILEICSNIKGDKALATNKGAKELLENFYPTVCEAVCDQDFCNNEDGHDMILSCCGERVVGGYDRCETIVLEGAQYAANVMQMPNLKSRGWSLVKFGTILVYTKNPEIANALKNPKKSEIRVEKPVQDAIIDVEKEPVAKPVGTTPDPTVLFPEEKEVEKEEKKPYKPMKKKW